MIINFMRYDGHIENMSVEEFSRWMCLAEALYLIDEKTKELKVDPEHLKKSSAIGDYINARYPAMLHDMKYEKVLGNI